MSDEIVQKKKKTVSYTQFSTWFTCGYKFYRDYVLKERIFEDNLIMSFGIAVHDTIQLYIKTLYTLGEKKAEKINMMKYFLWAFKRQVVKKNIIHTKADWDGFVEDGKSILSEFKHPLNRKRYFPVDKWEFVGVEYELKVDVKNNIDLVAYLDLVLKDKQTGNIKIIDFKTSTLGWNASTKENFTKTSQLVLYKTLYSKKYNIPLNKIQIEFFILRRKMLDAKYAQSRLETFSPPSYQNDVVQLINEFGKFIDATFTPDGEHNLAGSFPKIPGKNRSNCKYCLYGKNKKCDQVPDPLD